MHREIRDDIEDLLAGADGIPGQDHLSHCEECRNDVETMSRHAALLKNLKAPADLDTDLRPGFYARVMERIEAEGPVSIWNMFVESAFGKRIAVASVSLALLLGIYLFSSERSAEDPIVASQIVAGGVVADQPGAPSALPAQVDMPVLPASAVEGLPNADGLTLPDPAQMESLGDQGVSQDDVLVNLVTFREQ